MIKVVEYDPDWVNQFNTLFKKIRKATWSSIEIEHVGSTAVPGLAAKPIIDLDIVVCQEEVQKVISHLEKIGYEHRGNLGIEDREAFFIPKDCNIIHHLYVCVRGSTALDNHLTLRNYLRKNQSAVAYYSKLKKQLAKEFTDDIDAYISGKTEFITAILQNEGMRATQISSIINSNKQS